MCGIVVVIEERDGGGGIEDVCEAKEERERGEMEGRGAF